MVLPGVGRASLISAIARCWGVPVDTAAHFDSLHKPAVSCSGGFVTVGRVVLPRHPEASGHPGTSNFALTGHASRNLERAAAAVAAGEPVLLVGETGTGKTALVQELARSVGAPFTAVNLSTQSDAADLLGGFRPLDARVLCAPLAAAFQGLFSATFAADSNAEFLSRVVRGPYCHHRPRPAC